MRKLFDNKKYHMNRKSGNPDEEEAEKKEEEDKEVSHPQCSTLRNI